MRLTNYKYLLIALLLLPHGMWANGDGKYKKEKTIRKAYNVNKNVLVDVAHSYGMITVTTWEQNRAEIDVLVKVTGNNEREVSRRFDEIGVEFKTVNSAIYARSSVDHGNGGGITIEVNFIVKMPKSGRVKLENEYGHIRLTEIDGASSIICKYGQINVDALNNATNTVNIEYSGGSRIGFMNGGNLNTQYSDVMIAHANKVNLTSEYSNVRTKNIGDLKFNCSYGEINADNASVITGKGEYTTTRFSTVKKLVNISADYGHINIGNLEKTVKNVAIVSAYTSINIGYPTDYAFDFEIHNKFQKLDNREFKYVKKIENVEDSYYKGYYRTSGANKIFIKSEYAPVNFLRN